MGDIMMGSATHKGDISMLTPEQQSQWSSMIQNLGPDAQAMMQQYLQPQTYEGNKEMFEEQYVKPAQQAHERFTVPGIQQRFVDTDAGASSAMNQALSQSATDLSSSLGSQYGQFMQGQQGMQQNMLAQLMQILTGQSMTPLIQERQGIAGPMVKAGGDIAAGAVASSKEVKENIEDYHKGLSELNKVDVKKYDYKKEFMDLKNQVGVIAEDLPSEITSDIDGVKHVHLYGLIGLLINSVKELDAKIEAVRGV